MIVINDSLTRKGYSASKGKEIGSIAGPSIKAVAVKYENAMELP